MAQIFQLLLAGGLGAGRRYFAFMKTGCLQAFLCVAGQGGRASTGLLLLCFLVIRSLPFHHRPIWKSNAQHDDNGGHPHSGDSQEQILAMYQSGDQWVHL